jgi:tetratricopeptide (TPR) repeat protein
MFKQLFQSMNEALDLIMGAYPTSNESEKRLLMEQLETLRSMSDGIIEEWLLFEEKLAKVKHRTAAGAHAHSHSTEGDGYSEYAEPEHYLRSNDAFQRGEGYFKLLMFQEAVREFQRVIDQHPEFLIARLYLALSFLQTERVPEAYSHLQILVSLADEGRLKAVAYNALGCVQALNGNVEKACEFFKESHKIDPDLKDPVYNLKACLVEGGVLQLGVAIG